jgi:hypothetical protein
LTRVSNTGRAAAACHIGKAQIEVIGHCFLNRIDAHLLGRFLAQQIAQQILDFFSRNIFSG